MHIGLFPDRNARYLQERQVRFALRGVVVLPLAPPQSFELSVLGAKCTFWQLSIVKADIPYNMVVVSVAAAETGLGWKRVTVQLGKFSA
jgi:hypothetical protein